MDVMNQPLHFCPVCYSVLGRGGPQQCRHCREYVSEPVQMTTEAFATMERKSCPSCAKAIPTPAEICPECGQEVDDSADARPTLPDRHQQYFDFQTYEDSRVYVPLPAGSDPPEIDDIVERLGLGGIVTEVLSANPPSPIGPDESRWEFEFLASLEGVEVREAWVADDYGTGYEIGERFKMWLMPTPERLTGFDVLLDEAPEGARDAVEQSEWTLGLNGHCSQNAAETFRFQLTVARFAAGDEIPIIDETAGRYLEPERVQRIVRKRARLDDTYEVYEVAGDNGVWLHTGGVPRIGGYELEMLQVPGDRVREATSVLRTAVPYFCESTRPTPYRVHELDSGSRQTWRYMWVPMRDAEAFFEGATGTGARDRGRLIFPSAVLITEAFHPDAFAAASSEFVEGGTPSQQQRSQAQRAAGQPAATSGPPAAQGGPPAQQPDSSMQKAGPQPSAPPAIAALASLMLPGIGHLFVGQTSKGLLLIFSALGLAVFTCGLSLLFHPIFAIDAYLLAEKAQNGQQIGEWDFF